MIKRSIGSALVLVVVFICLIAMACPMQSIAHFVPEGQAVATYYPRDLYSLSGAEVYDNGDVKITGANPNVYVNEINRTTRTIAIKLKEPVSESFAANMYYDTGNGLNESEKVYSSAFKGDNLICFALPTDSHCVAARIDINIDYKIDSINVYDTEPNMVLSNIVNPWWEYLICAVVAIATFIAVFFLDIKFNFFGKICDCLSGNKFAILKGLIGVCGCALLAAGFEFICGLIFGPTTAGHNFNVYRFLLVLGVILTLAAIAFFIKSVNKKPENLFLTIMLISGFVMIFASPFGHIAWDVETHYKWALNSSYIGQAYKTEADRYVINNQDLYWSKENALDNQNNIELVNASDDYVVEEFYQSKRLTHIPSGIFIALSRFFGLNFYWTLTLGRVPNLLIYAFACYFGMRKLKSGKMIMAVLAFFPTNLFVATNFSYDYWLNGLSMLGIAYFVSEMQQPQKQITLKENIIMCASLALACLPKQIYAPLLLIPFFLRKTNFEKRKRYYAICMSAFIVLLVLLALRSLSSVTSSGDLRGGSDIGPMQQVKFILGNPFTYAKTLLNFLWSYLSIGGAKDYICNMAYIGYGFGHGIMLSLMLFTAFTDKNQYDVNNKYLLVKCFNLLLLFGVASLVSTALYISFTAVGSDVIRGCQGRYLMPLLLPVMSVIGSGFVNNTIDRKWYNSLILCCCGMVNFVTIALTMVSKLL